MCMTILREYNFRTVKWSEFLLSFTMFMNTVIRTLTLVSRRNLGSRTFLSESYRCQEVWNNRLNSPILKRVNLDNLYQALDQSFHVNERANTVDVDLFANSVEDDSYAEELEDIIHKLRLSQYTSNMLPSTHHAVIRAYLSIGKYDTLLTILNDRLNYGIFPDSYCLNLMMDQFLKEKFYREAAKVATLQMLQEDWSNQITSLLGIYSCHLYLLNRKSDPWIVEVENLDESKEEVKKRVKYIQNKYFDDHFDLRDPNHLIGKTLVTLSRAIPVNDPLRATYTLIGWALYEKWFEAKSVVHKFSHQCIISDGVNLLRELLYDSNGKCSSEEAEDLLKLLSSPKISFVSQSNLLEMTEAKVEEAVAKNEKRDIENQLEKLMYWEKLREEEVEIQRESLRRESVLQKMNEKRKEISEKEEVLFFFENKDTLDVKIEKNDSLKAQISKTEKRVKRSDEDYVPPEIK